MKNSIKHYFHFHPLISLFLNSVACISTVDFPEQLRVRHNLLEKMLEFSGQFLSVLCDEVSSGRQRLMEHPYYLHPLIVIQMKEHVLADNKAVIISDGLQGTQVMVLEKDLIAELVHHPVMSGNICGLEVFFEILFRHALKLVIMVYCVSNDIAEPVFLVVVCRVYAQVIKRKAPHLFRQGNGDGICLLAESAACILYLCPEPAARKLDGMGYSLLNYRKVSHEKCKCHFSLTPLISCQVLKFDPLDQLLDVQYKRDPAVAKDCGP